MIDMIGRNLNSTTIHITHTKIMICCDYLIHICSYKDIARLTG